MQEDLQEVVHALEQVTVQADLHEPEQEFEQLPTQVVLQVVLHALVQTSSHPKEIFLHDCNVFGTAMAITAIPKMGKVFFAASLKNCLLLWVSLFLSFSIAFLPRLLPILAHRG